VRQIIIRGLGAGAALLLLAGPALAQQADKPSNSVGFQAVEGPIKENLPGWPFLYGAYTVLWVLMMGYVIFLWLRQRKLDDQIARVDQRLAQIDQKLDALDEGRP
jgi:hypothetical protein